jgi:hypothetical protein
MALLTLPLSACNVWTVPEFNTVPFNAVSGDTVNVEMVDATIDGVHPWDRCMDYGGAGMRHDTKEVAVASSDEDVVLSAILSVIICESVDF